MAVCGKCIHKNVCGFCKEMGFENVVRANDFNCKDYMPTADVVKVVRCEKCKHLNHTQNNVPYCEWWTEVTGGNYTHCLHEVSYDGFCSYGERKQKNDFKEEIKSESN